MPCEKAASIADEVLVIVKRAADELRQVTAPGKTQDRGVPAMRPEDLEPVWRLLHAAGVGRPLDDTSTSSRGDASLYGTASAVSSIASATASAPLPYSAPAWTHASAHVLRVENLPSDVHEAFLRMLFGSYGAVARLEVLRQVPFVREAVAWVEYDAPWSAEVAAKTLHGLFAVRPGGGPIRVTFGGGAASVACSTPGSAGSSAHVPVGVGGLSYLDHAALAAGAPRADAAPPWGGSWPAAGGAPAPTPPARSRQLVL